VQVIVVNGQSFSIEVDTGAFPSIISEKIHPYHHGQTMTDLPYSLQTFVYRLTHVKNFNIRLPPRYNSQT